MKKFLLSVFLLLALLGVTYSEAGKPRFFVSSEAITVTNNGFADTTEGANVVTDGVFEAVTEGVAIAEDDMQNDNTVGWSSSGGKVFDTDHYEFSTATIFVYFYIAAVALIDGKCYKISMDVKDGTASGKTVRLIFYDTAWHFSGNITTTGNWVTHTFYFNTVASAMGAVGVIIDSDLGGNNVEFKNFYCKPVTFTSWTDTSIGLAPQAVAGALTNKAAFNGSQPPGYGINQYSANYVIGRLFKTTFTTVRSAGNLRIDVGSAGTGTPRSTSGTFTEYLVGRGNNNLYLTAVDGNYIGSFDTVIAKRVTLDSWTAGTGWNPDTAMAGKAQATAGTASDLEIDVSASAGVYTLTYTTAGATTGTLTPQIGGVDGTAVTTENTTNTVRITATGTGNLKFQKSATWNGTVDAITLTKLVIWHSMLDRR